MPTWARASKRISAGAPASTRVSRIGVSSVVLGPGVELAVGVGPGAAFAVEEIRLGIELAAAREAGDGPASLAQRRAAFDQVDGDSIRGETPGGVETGRPAPDDGDPA